MHLALRRHIKRRVGLGEEGHPETGKFLSAELQKTDFSRAVCLDYDTEAANGLVL